MANHVVRVACPSPVRGKPNRCRSVPVFIGMWRQRGYGVKEAQARQGKQAAADISATAVPPPGERLHAVGDGVVPEPVQSLQGAVHLSELLGVDTAHLLDRADMPLVEAADHLRDGHTLGRQADPHRATIDARPLVVDQDAFLVDVSDVSPR